MKKILGAIVILFGMSMGASAQVSVPNTFVTGTPILASEMNANFDALESGALNRTGGTITGNIAVDSGITIDSIDIGAVLGGTGTPTFSTLTVTGAATVGSTLGVTGNFAINTNMFNVTAANGNTLVAGTMGITGATTVAALTASGAIIANGTVDINSTFTIGSGSVEPFDSTGKLQALSSTYVANLSGTNLTGVAMLGSSNTFTAGVNNFLAYSETKVVITPSASMTVDLSLGSHFTLSNTTTGSIAFSNPPASGKAGAFTIAVTGNGTSHPITWPGSVLWAGAAAPTLTVTNAKTDFFTFITYDGGTTWYGFVGGQNF
jgi:hypothetical protein